MLKVLRQFYASSVGKKVVVALTGLAMIGWLVGHVLGNLQVFDGRGVSPELTRINAYAQWLHANQPLLWGVRISMFVILTLHIVTIVLLTRQNRAARPQPYATQTPLASSFASRTMLVGGLILVSYLVYHILHLTTGSVHQDLFVAGDVYDNMIRSFQNPWIVVAYLVGQVALWLHLSHGFQSTFRSLGLSHSRYLQTLRTIGFGLSTLVVLGFASIPVAIYLGWIS